MLSDKDLHSIYNEGAQHDHISGLKMVWDRAITWVSAELAGLHAAEQSMIVKTRDVIAHLEGKDLSANVDDDVAKAIGNSSMNSAGIPGNQPVVVPVTPIPAPEVVVPAIPESTHGYPLNKDSNIGSTVSSEGPVAGTLSDSVYTAPGQGNLDYSHYADGKAPVARDELAAATMADVTKMTPTHVDGATVTNGGSTGAEAVPHQMPGVENDSPHSIVGAPADQPVQPGAAFPLSGTHDLGDLTVANQAPPEHNVPVGLQTAPEQKADPTTTRPVPARGEGVAVNYSGLGDQPKLADGPTDPTVEPLPMVAGSVANTQVPGEVANTLPAGTTTEFDAPKP